jgi:hypothetical protein
MQLFIYPWAAMADESATYFWRCLLHRLSPDAAVELSLDLLDLYHVVDRRLFTRLKFPMRLHYLAKMQL